MSCNCNCSHGRRQCGGYMPQGRQCNAHGCRSQCGWQMQHGCQNGCGSHGQRGCQNGCGSHGHGCRSRCDSHGSPSSYGSQSGQLMPLGHQMYRDPSLMVGEANTIQDQFQGKYSKRMYVMDSDGRMKAVDITLYCKIKKRGCGEDSDD